MGIRRLRIKRYRGIEWLEWYPHAGINALIGPGDSGKTTVLNAIALLLTPRPNPTVGEYDYFRRQTSEGFSIEAVLDMPADIAQTMRVQHQHGWRDNVIDPIPTDEHEPVLLARVSGTAEMEIHHEILDTDGSTTDQFRVGVRRQFLLTQFTIGLRALAELRMLRGSLLERHLSDVDFREPLGNAMAAASAALEVPGEAKTKLDDLRRLLGDAGVSDDVHLGLMALQERSMFALLGLLTGTKVAEAIPLAYSGTGTTQLVLFKLAAALAAQRPTVVFDEVEVGLEPYRQRKLIHDMRELLGSKGQAFLTTHSASIIEILKPEEITRFARRQPPAPLANAELGPLLREHPETFLCLIPVLCEGPTERGFFQPLLANLAQEEGLVGLDALGVVLVGRQGYGQPEVLRDAASLLDLGISCGLFVDNEAEHAGRRATLSSRSNCVLGSWAGVVNVEQAVATHIPHAEMDELVRLAAELDGRSAATPFLQKLGEALSHPGTATVSQLIESHGEEVVRAALGALMNDDSWFKTFEKGKRLGEHLLSTGVPSAIDQVLRKFFGELQALRAQVIEP